jgi:preprotein translocase subunit SecF
VELIKPGTNINFVGNRKYAYLFSGILAILALLSIPIKGQVKLGIDFAGGALIQVKFNKPVDTQEIRQALGPLGENVIVQKFALATEEFMIRTDLPEGGAEGLSKKVKDLLEEKIGRGNVDIRSVETVGPKVGKDLRQAAVWATIIALGMLLVYVWFRFELSMAIGAILCLVHDVLMIYGIWVWADKEFNLTILAAMLTVIGYDVNDTIVVCDRIRENLPTMRGKPLAEVLNISINQTLSRTILTSGFTLLVVFALLILETQVLRDFAWALAIGIFFGTYSSIFVATPLVLAWDRVIPIKRA